MQIDRTYRSPNFDSRGGRPIRSIILHATVGSARSALAWLTNPAARVSSHYVVAKDGKVYQLVDDEHAAWHAGRAVWQGEAAVNETSIGIEIENANDGKDPYPEPQLVALTELVLAKVEQYRLGPGSLARHVDVALPRGRKSDPRGFPWAAFQARIFPDNQPPGERPPRPEPTPDQRSDLANAMRQEAFKQVGAAGQQFWALAREAERLALGMPIGSSFDLRVGGRLYSAQSFGRDTLICPMGEWRTITRLSGMSSPADQPLRDALLAAIYDRAGEIYRPDWAMHQEALRIAVGPPLDKGARLKVGGQEYVAACYALDVLYSPVGRWKTVGRLTRLAEGGQAGALRQALYARWCERIGVPPRIEWPLHQEALRSQLGAPLGPSFRVRSAGRDYAAEAFAADVLACEIGEWGTIVRLSALAGAAPAPATATKGGAPAHP